MPRAPVVADTGALYALIDASDRWHARVRDWWSANTRPVILPVTILPEVAYLLGTRIGTAAETAFVQAVAEDEFAVEALEGEDLTRAVVLMERYADLPLGFVDATVIALAERLGARDVLTTDRRHFGVVRPRGAASLRLLP